MSILLSVVMSCLAGGLPAPCEYLPLYDDLGPVVDLAGIDDGRAWNPAVDPIADRLERVTLNDKGIYTTQATCNDGSPGVMWIRRATAPADEDKWLIVLEGGGSGLNPQTPDLALGMWNRWVDPLRTSQLNWLKKASTDWRDAAGNPGRDGVADVPLELKNGGVMDSATSRFATWNWVYVNYCSSDLWAGRVTGLELPTIGSWTDGGVLKEGFKADFNGHYVLEASLALLRRNFPWGTDANPVYVMPDIDTAETVIVAGESAGGAGVQNNLDWFQYALSAYNPGVTVLGSIGASLKPAIGVLGVDPWAFDDDLDGVDDVQEGLENHFLELQQMNGFLDVSCMTSLGDWRCTQGYQLVLDQITTPHIVKQDVTDSLLSDTYPTVPDFQAGVIAAFADLQTAGVPFFGPNCGDHESLTSSPIHISHQLDLRRWDAAAGLPTGPSRRLTSYNDAIWNFYLRPAAPLLVDFAYDDKHDFFLGFEHVWLSRCP